ncbi:MAG: PBSX family phage terminase large subunit [Clostridia bacterium]|nr:PBSX family phage terminase large subunit [Clostridia bacterium]
MFKHGDLKRINVLEGSVRSGKTWISLVIWACWVATMPEDGGYLMVGKTLTALRRNCLDVLQQLVGVRNFTYSLGRKEAQLFGRLVYLEGVNDARAEGKIRGLTLTGAYCDELTLFTEDFFTMLLSRLSMPGAKLIGTTNPDAPTHWLKVNWIDRAGDKMEPGSEPIDLFSMRFVIDDNTTLSPEYIAEIKKEYTGVFYDRFIRGMWTRAEGLVYPNFDPVKHVVSDVPDEGLYYISVDYGTMNPCSMGLWCIAGGKAVRIREYYYDGRKERRQQTDEDYYQALERLADDLPIERVIVDPSAASFITTIRRHDYYSVRKARNDVLDGIRFTGTLLDAGVIQIHESCIDIIREFSAYSWDDKKTEDAVIKEDDHAMDDMRYFCMTILRKEDLL